MIVRQKAIHTFSLTILFSFLIWEILPAGTSAQIPRRGSNGLKTKPLSVPDVSTPPDSTAISPFDGGDLIIDVPAGGSVAKARKSGHRNSAIKDVSSWIDLQMQPLRGGLEAYGKEGSGITNIQMEAFATKLITSESIERMPVSDIEDILANQVGVVRMWRSGSADLHFHGGGAGEVTYLADGMEVTDPFTNSLGITLDKGAISQISLYPGWFPAEYGRAMSGVVNITTKEGTDRYKGAIEYGSDGILKDGANRLGYNRIRFNFGGPLPTAFRSCFFLSGNLWDADNWSPGILSKPHNDKDQKNILAKLNFRPLNNLRLTVGGNWAYEKYHLYDHQRSRGDWLKDGPLCEDGNSLVYLSLNHSLSQNISYTLNLSQHKTYSRHSSQDGRNYRDFRAIGPGLDWVRAAIDSGWYDQEKDSWESGLDPDGVWLWYYTQLGWYHPTSDTSEAHWETITQKQEAYNDRWYDTGCWHINNEDTTDIYYEPFDLDGYLWEVANTPEHRSDKYKGDIDEWAYPYPRDEFGYFIYNFFPRWYDRSSTSYTVDFALTAQVGKYNQVKAGFYWRRDFLNHTDIQFVNARPYSDHYEKEPVNIAAYLQDELRYKRLALNAGLRYDYFKPDTNSKSEHQWNPRIGLVFSPFRGTSVSASYARYFHPHPLKEYGWEMTTKPPYKKSDILQFGAKQNLIWNGALQIDGYYNWWKDKKIWCGRESWRIWGGDISLIKTVSRYLSGSASYSYLNAKGKKKCYHPGYGLFKWEYPLDTDVTNSIKIGLNAFLPDKFGPRIIGLWPLSNINVNLQHRYYSGSPYTPLDSRGNPLLPNSKRSPSTHQTDMKIVKSFKVARCWQYGLFLDVRNLFNVKNVTDIYYKTGEPDDNGEAPIWDPSQYQNYEQRGYNSAREWWGADYVNWKEYVNHPIHYGIPRIVRIGIWVKL